MLKTHCRALSQVRDACGVVLKDIDIAADDIVADDCGSVKKDASSSSALNPL